MANDISRSIISTLSRATSGPAYEEAIRTGAIYWGLVLDGKDSVQAKQEHDEALSKLLGCEVLISGRKFGLKEKILRAFHDSTSARHQN